MRVAIPTPVDTSRHVIAPALAPMTAAWTLIETLLVVALIAITVGTGTVSCQGRRAGHALDVAGADLSASIRYARATATTTSRAHRVVFSPEKTAFRVEVADPTVPAGFTPAQGIPGRWRHFADGVRVLATSLVATSQVAESNLATPEVTDAGASTAPSLLFTADGGATNAGTFHGTVTLANRQDERLLVQVAAVSGQVTVQRVAAAGSAP